MNSDEASSVPDLGHGIPADQIYRPEEVNRDDPNIRVVELPPPQEPSFKEKMHGMYYVS